MGWTCFIHSRSSSVPLAPTLQPLSLPLPCLCIARHARFKDNEDGMQEAKQIFTQLDDLDKEDMNMNHKANGEGDSDWRGGPEEGG